MIRDYTALKQREWQNGSRPLVALNGSRPLEVLRQRLRAEGARRGGPALLGGRVHQHALPPPRRRVAVQLAPRAAPRPAARASALRLVVLGGEAVPVRDRGQVRHPLRAVRARVPARQPCKANAGSQNPSDRSRCRPHSAVEPQKGVDSITWYNHQVFHFEKISSEAAVARMKG
jgi:hypothetical protein